MFKSFILLTLTISSHGTISPSVCKSARLSVFFSLSEILSFSQFNSPSVSGIVFQCSLACTSVCLTDSVLVCQSYRESVSPPQSLSVHHRVCQSTTESVCPPESLLVFFSTCQSFNLFCLSVLLSLKYSLQYIFLPGWLSFRLLLVC